MSYLLWFRVKTTWRYFIRSG